ncbi:hypothetical protein IVB45_09645 [Bradyrhizobium sp. 4]|uniref:DUF5681 domain-containing protein n=1 Tax=unclassified Bradyrhizobium TaxID=2631580 RepID=UPI001FF91A07|nr:MULTISPECIES: DUF5681 domain-containing protein [unclassified Bradyrhizobium]MCK1397088.1 hypothetical protein [Bradyrhizobium sp. 39]MCK1752874.1 hypothetical protein [Bradyrhizobium sp. 135]UPJ37071.1 hypothetical protein IVB45_09645 [Bradyrhizobium sp. 4]
MKKLTRSTQSPTYDVGYGKPPEAYQFKKGQTGNPRGRKKSDENLIMVFKRLANRLVKFSVNGETQTMSMAQLIIMQNMKAALNRDQIAMGNIMKLMEISGEYLDWSNPDLVGKPIIVPEKWDNTDELLALHGVGTVRMPSSHQTDDS